ncbi:MAG: hypothetical protein HDR18_03455 [Lachnospiraceae bacterium]|nr:hypothetical protein [Lachnospiraceae bacterium]
MNLNQNNDKQTNFQSGMSQSDRSVIDMALQNAHGKIPYGMTNDYMFRAVLQSNNKALRGLICSLLHLTEKEVFSVEITNPIILGESVESKEVRLDINVLLNNRTMINLEMQVANQLNWQNRSVVYLCRSYDSLNHGQDYDEANSVIHIGFLDYTLFRSRPEFYASYKLINVKNYQKYSDNITLNVVDLTRIDLATEEDKVYHIDGWAKLLKATTWEEVNMLAAKDENMREASKSIFVYNTEEQIRKMCRDREEYYQDLRNYERAVADRDLSIASYQKAISDRDRSIASYEKVLSDRDRSIASYEKVLSDRDRSIASYKKVLSDRDRSIASYEKVLSNRDRSIESYQKAISDRDQSIANYEKSILEKDTQIQQLHAEIEKLKTQ